MADNMYLCEYAKSGRSKCKDTKCKTVIAKDALRIGKETLLPEAMGGDGEATQVHWFHPSCAFRMLKRARKDTKKIEEEDTLRNFEEMKSDDQAYLRKLIAGEQLWEVSGPPPADRLKPINPPKPKAEKTTKSAAKRKIPANQVQEVDSAAKRAKTTVGGSGSSPSLWQKLTSQELSFGLSWAQTPDATCAYLHSASLPGSAKIASFDMDSTLISTKSGAKFPKHAGDWQWWSGSVVKTLQKYHAEGYKLVIFTNQAGVEKKRVNLKDIQAKIGDLVKSANLPIHAMISCATNHFRKPHSTMWDYFVKNLNQGVAVDMQQCFYVGDAAGRLKGPAGGKGKRDFGCSDRKFARNCGLRFLLPEQAFSGLKVEPAFEWRTPEPSTFLESKAEESQAVDDLPPGFRGSLVASTTQELVIFVGSPASGKSSFAQKHLVSKGYGYVNQDTLGSGAKCIKACRAFLAEGKSVVVDNTNPMPKSRSDYLSLAASAKVPARCFVFDASRELANHLNFVREALTEGKRRRVPAIAFHSFRKRLQPPELAEGFKEICTIQFVPSFKDEEAKRLFLQMSE